MQEYKPGKNFIRALANGLSCLATFTPEQPSLTLSDVAKANGMNLVTARRYLLTLKELGYIHQDDKGRYYRLSPKVLRLGSWIIESMDLRTTMLPFMNDLSRELNVTTGCAILEGEEVVYLERIRGRDVVNLDLTSGSRLPIHCTSLGKAIAAFLPVEQRMELLNRIQFTPFTPYTIRDIDRLVDELTLVRKRGYAVADQELSMGLVCIAVPLFGKDQQVMASMQASYSASRGSEPGLVEELLKRLLAVSRETLEESTLERGNAA